MFLSTFFIHSSRGGDTADDEGEYAASRYSPPLKAILEELVTNSLSLEDYPSVLPMPEMGPTTSSGGSSGAAASARGGAARSARNSRRGEAASARKSTGPSNRWAKSTGVENKRGIGPVSFSGGRSIVFVMGGMSYQELKVTRDVMINESREIVVGSTTFLSPSEFVSDLTKLGQEDE
jgi:syntaxin-binding protein 1